MENGCKTVAFPSISTGVYHFPLDRAAAIAVGSIWSFLETDGTLERVRIVCFDDTTLAAYNKALSAVGRG